MKRLEKVLKIPVLLKNTEKSVICIAEESGFQSLRNFNRFFKENFNIFNVILGKFYHFPQ